MKQQQVSLYNANNNLQISKPKKDADKVHDEFSDLFANIKSALRFAFFACFISYVAFLFISVTSDVKDGGTLSVHAVISKIRQHVRYLNQNIPIFNYLWGKLSALLYSHQLNYVIFLSSLIGTVVLLIFLFKI